MAYHAAADCAWHEKNCRDDDFLRVNSIREAYSIGEDYRDHEKKQHKKFVQRLGGEIGEMGTGNKYDNIEFTKLGPAKLSCDACGEFICDRQMTRPFYFCRNCRSAKRKVELCVNCWNNGVLDVQGNRRERELEKQRRSRDIPSNWGEEEENPWVGEAAEKRRSKADGQFEKLPDQFDPNHDHKKFARQFHTVADAYPGDRGKKIKLLKCDECQEVILRKDDDARKSLRDDVKSFFVCVHCRDLAPDGRRYELCVKCIVKR